MRVSLKFVICPTNNEKFVEKGVGYISLLLKKTTSQKVSHDETPVLYKWEN